MNALLNWIDRRTGLCAALRNCLGRTVPGGPAWHRVWPATLLFTFVVQAVTGVVLWMYYSPSAQTAWESVFYLQYKVAGGWLLRAVHHYAAQVMLVLIGVYLLQMIVRGTYRAPREFVFWLALLMGMITLALLLTGDLLAWDQNSYTATLVRTKFLLLLPCVGNGLFKLAIGGPGPGLGHFTLTRFLALHIGVLSGAFLLLLVLHGLVVRRAEREAAPGAGVPQAAYWPGQALRNAVACLAVMVVVLLLSLQHGTGGERAGLALGVPADPAESYSAARPEWAFLGLYEFSHLCSLAGIPPILPIFVVPKLLGVVVFLMPFIGRAKRGYLFNVFFAFGLLFALAALSIASLRRDAKDPEFREAVAAGRRQASRARQLAAGQGIPVGGALALLRNDPKTRGPELFQTHCAACHDFTDDKGKGIKAEESSAPNLFGFASREWIAGLLDPKQIGGTRYFGNTELKKMKGYVRGNLDGLNDEEKQAIELLVLALSAEAGLRSQREADGKDSQRIKVGRTKLSDWPGCIDCHKFREKGQLGDAPDLTGYGSREWLVGIISKPMAKRFYGDRNDRMPAYAEFPQEPGKNRLSDRDIGLLADWLRGEWFER